MSDSQAFGAPGNIPHWAPADKDGIGAGYSAANRVWFTLWRGSMTEVFYPNLDLPQVRDLQLVITDGKSLVHSESTDFENEVSRIGETSLAYRVKGTDHKAGYRFEKEVICDPDLPGVLQHFRIWADDGAELETYVVCSPHLEGQGTGEEAHVLNADGNNILLAHKHKRWLALCASCGFARASVGFAGSSDGLTDLRENYRMDYEFQHANGGNVVLMGQIPPGVQEFTLVLAFGEAAHGALTTLRQSLASKFQDKCERYLQQWQAACQHRGDVHAATCDNGRLYEISYKTLCAHEDRIYPGAFVASLAVPWGEVKTAITREHAGYHLVWPRDAVNCATAVLASGDRDTPLRTLIYLAVSQRADGSFAQNFWINGEPNWKGLQLDEVTYPILLARKLDGQQALLDFNPRPMVYRAAEYIVHRGPITPQERWEQMSGYSPSTIAIVIASMLGAAEFAREDGKTTAATFFEDYADWMRENIENWTVTTAGDLVPDCRRYIIRITPATAGEADPVSPNEAMLKLPDQPPGAQQEYPARNIVDAGFLEFVRYGILKADDPLVVDSLRVVDAMLKVETPFGPCWHRFNHDGYGQRDGGGPYMGWGNGRAWPLLTGERGHYALRAGQDVKKYVATMEGLAGQTGLLAEQVWDEPFVYNGQDYFGRPTGSANPLAWAHAEYIKLVRSVKDGRVFDLPLEVEKRYGSGAPPSKNLAMWTRNYPTRVMRAGQTLRIYNREAFRLRYSIDNWAQIQDLDATGTDLAVYFVDVPIALEQKAPVRFTFFWTGTGKWNGYDYSVAVSPR